MKDVKRFLTKICDKKIVSKSTNSTYYCIGNKKIRYSDHVEHKNDLSYMSIVVINDDVCIVNLNPIEIHCYKDELLEYVQALLVLGPHLEALSDIIKSRNGQISSKDGRISKLEKRVKELETQYSESGMDELLNSAIKENENCKNKMKEMANELSKCKVAFNNYKGKVIDLLNRTHSTLKLFQEEGSHEMKVKNAKKV